MALSETIVRKNTAANVLRWGTGASSIDPGRIPTQDRLGGGGEKAATSGNSNTGGIAPGWMIPDASEIFAAKVRDDVAHAEVLGRWPSTLIHDNSEEVLEMFAAFGKKNPACLRRKPGGIANAGELPMDHGTAPAAFSRIGKPKKRHSNALSIRRRRRNETATGRGILP